MVRMTLALVLGLVACTDTASTDTSQFAIDTDGNGSIDCTDLDHVVTCIHHPDPHGCAHADVNEDGAVDHQDLHDIYAGLAATGHHCDDPGLHDPADHATHDPAH